MLEQLLTDLRNGNTKALARSISLVENEQPGYDTLLLSLPAHDTTRVTGITGPPRGRQKHACRCADRHYGERWQKSGRALRGSLLTV